MFSGGLSVKNLVLSLLWRRFNPWPRNFHKPWVWPKDNHNQRSKTLCIKHSVYFLDMTIRHKRCRRSHQPGIHKSLPERKRSCFWHSSHKLRRVEGIILLIMNFTSIFSFYHLFTVKPWTSFLHFLGLTFELRLPPDSWDHLTLHSALNLKPGI